MLFYVMYHYVEIIPLISSENRLTGFYEIAVEY